MIPKRVVLENFLSFGEPAAEFVFTDDEPLWVLSGANGVGKSAVFDAMTYALFGCHRGGRGQGMEELIRHGANGFRVVFEFEFDHTDFRLTRTYNLRGRSTQKVERRDRDSGAWESVAGVNSVGEVKAWTERTLGLGFEAFASSVLLRQGQADAILTAGGTERQALLKKIIGAEQFERLSQRVHAAAGQCKGRLEDLQARLDHLPDVTAEELAAAAEALAAAEAQRAAASTAAAASAGRVTTAKQWAALEEKRRRLAAQIADADARANEAERIRADKQRLDDLAAAVPVLGQAVTLRERRATAVAALERRRAEQTRLSAERDRLTTAKDQERQKADAARQEAETSAAQAKRLNEEVARDRKFLAAADDVAKLRDELAAFAPDLADKFAAAQSAAHAAAEHCTAVGQVRATITELLRQVRAQHTKFAEVEVGVTCSLCGQVVSAEHAERERQRLAGDVRDLGSQLAVTTDEERSAETARTAADAERARLDAQVKAQARAAHRLDDKRQTLADLGMTADAAALRAQLAVRESEAKDHERQSTAAAERQRAAANEAKRLDAEHVACLTRLAELDRQVRDAERAEAADAAKANGLRERLAPDWQARLDTLDTDAVAALERERATLTDSGVAERFRALEQDANRRAEWAGQLTEVAEQIETVPADARVPVADAENTALAARTAAAAADQQRDAAKEAADALNHRADQRRELVAEVAAAELASRRHGTLDELLGKEGLQRELVREAERDIVHAANDTVRQLSDGDLSIELDDSDSAAFALRVRRVDDPTPIGVSYLSGSQKFRVAVAVALAIGRFAAGQARPLESVIIDEGFGSLDRDGLEAMAGELARLKQFLKRIVLVSHQEEFAGRFPVGYRLARGDSGTTATAFRQ